nr:MAG TPA: hypothetical protein [Caudoviricetes sp.]
MAYTYEDVKKKISDNGLYMSDADMRLAERNPDAGMSLVNYKLDYASAASDEARALANKAAEKLRNEYGGYSAGEDGSKYYLTTPTPSSFDQRTAPSFSSRYSSDVKSRYDALKDYKPFDYGKEAPTFDDKYAGTRDELIGQITNPEKFSYDHSNDESYKAYAKQYRREGDRATENALAKASAQSGGIASSYAMTAASQAGNYYASQLADKIPELYQNAYQRYLNEYQMKREALNAVQSETQASHDRYLGDLSQYNTDRNFEYQRYLDDYQRARNALSDASALEAQDYSRYRDSMSDYQNDRDFRYNQLLDTIKNNQYNDELKYSRAADAAGYGDYSQLDALGIDTSRARARDALSDEYSRAQLGGVYAGYGDYSYLDNMGVDTSGAKAEKEAERRAAQLELEYRQQQIANAIASRNDSAYSRRLELAKLAAAQGDYSMLKALGIDTSALEASASDGVSGEAALLEAANAYNSGKATAAQLEVLIRAGLITEDDIANIKLGGASDTTSNEAKVLEAMNAYKAGKATAAQIDTLIKAGIITDQQLAAAGLRQSAGQTQYGGQATGTAAQQIFGESTYSSGSGSNTTSYANKKLADALTAYGSGAATDAQKNLLIQAGILSAPAASPQSSGNTYSGGGSMTSYADSKLADALTAYGSGTATDAQKKLLIQAGILSAPAASPQSSGNAYSGGGSMTSYADSKLADALTAYGNGTATDVQKNLLTQLGLISTPTGSQSTSVNNAIDEILASGLGGTHTGGGGKFGSIDDTDKIFDSRSGTSETADTGAAHTGGGGKFGDDSATQSNTASKMVSESIWNKLKRTGTGDSAITAYDTYEDYRKAYEEYLRELAAMDMVNNPFYNWSY